MAAARVFAAFGFGETQSLAACLKRATDSGDVDVDPELLKELVTHSKVGEEERCAIMQHIQSCLAESECRWRRLHAGLVVAETLLKSGAPELLVEASEGRHFDIAQRLSLLEHFESSNDKRVQNMVRLKAKSLRSQVIAQMEIAQDKVGPSPCSVSSSLSSASAPVQPHRPKKQMIVNGVVAVGHREDTTSDSSADKTSVKKPAARPKSLQKHKCDTDSEDDRRDRNTIHDKAKREQAAPSNPIYSHSFQAMQSGVDLLNL